MWILSSVFIVFYFLFHFLAEIRVRFFSVETSVIARAEWSQFLVDY